MYTNLKARKKGMILSACIVLVLIICGIYIKAKLNRKTHEVIRYNSKEYQYVKMIDGEILGSARENTKSTGKFVGNMEIYTYDSDSSLLYLRSKSGDYLIYHTVPVP